jgi:hypothetical protein
MLQPRIRFATLAALAVAAISSAVLVGTPAAVAGESHPPLTNGYATFSPGHGVVNCKNGTPVSVTFSFRWDARTLNGQYHVNSTLVLVDPSMAAWLEKRAPATITAHKTGSYVHTFGVPARAAGNDVVLALSTTQGVSYNYVQSTYAVSCSHPKFTPVAPKVTATRVTCKGKIIVTFDNRASTLTWTYMFLEQPGGFGPGMKLDGKPDFSRMIKAGAIIKRIWTVSSAHVPWTLATLSFNGSGHRHAQQIGGAFPTKRPPC